MRQASLSALGALHAVPALLLLLLRLVADLASGLLTYSAAGYSSVVAAGYSSVTAMFVSRQHMDASAAAAGSHGSPAVWLADPLAHSALGLLGECTAYCTGVPEFCGLPHLPGAPPELQAVAAF